MRRRFSWKIGRQVRGWNQGGRSRGFFGVSWGQARADVRWSPSTGGQPHQRTVASATTASPTPLKHSASASSGRIPLGDLTPHVVAVAWADSFLVRPAEVRSGGCGGIEGGV